MKSQTSSNIVAEIIDDDLDKPINRAAIAEFLTEQGFPIAKRTLDIFATKGGGPAFAYWGRKPLYTKRTSLAWAKSRLSNLVHSTSENVEVNNDQ